MKEYQILLIIIWVLTSLMFIQNIVVGMLLHKVEKDWMNLEKKSLNESYIYIKKCMDLMEEFKKKMQN